MMEATPCQGRVTISGDVYQINGKEVVLMGGNYVVKAQPYYPPLEVVRSNAQSMFQGAQNMAYVPPPASNGAARPVVPCVRLGAMMEAALKEKGTTVDESFKTTLEGVVKTFQEEGVYVFLDMHQDACSTTNGGEGFPWWATADFQQRAGCKLEQCCCCCCFSRWCCECWPDSCRTPYITTPVYPLQPFFCLCNCLARQFGLDIATYDQDPVPWEPYSVGSEGNPAWMNVGNASMRRNNADSVWGSKLLTTAQSQNTARRVYGSKHNDADRAIFFDPFVSVVKYLCSVWEKYDNVIAVELMNEPPIAGLPDICYVLTVWSKILAFQADVMAELEKDATVPKSPIAIANWTSSVEGESGFIKLLTCCPCSGTPREAKKIFDSFAQQNRLILSFHFYSPPATGSFEEVIQLAKKNAIKLGGIPIFLSEYFENGAQLMADKLAVAVNQGANAVTYWHYCDRDYTQTAGWYIYPEEVQALGGVVSNAGINTPGWDVYKTTVADGTFWGAYITGAGGGRQNVLELVPATNVSASLPVPWPKNYTPLHHGLKCDPKSSDCAKDAKEAKDL